jgi:hypothetical protein
VESFRTVPGSPDAFDGGLLARIHDYRTGFSQWDASLFGQLYLRARPEPEHHNISLETHAVRAIHAGNASVYTCQGVHLDTGKDFNANGLHALSHQGPHVRIQGALEHRRSLGQHSRFHTLLVQRLGHLKTNVPASHYHRMLGPLLHQTTHCQRIIQGPHDVYPC